jgi:hypothetical protein
MDSRISVPPRPQCNMSIEIVLGSRRRYAREWANEIDGLWDAIIF